MSLSSRAVPGAPPVLLQLRAATAGCHADLENLLGLNAPLSRAHYVRVMQGFDAFLAGWEPAVRALAPEWLRDWLQRGLRGAAATRDVHVLHAQRLPAARWEVEVPDLASLFGTLYVIEGSALGAQLITGELHERLGVGERNGGAYFHHGGAQAGARWREFRQLLENFQPTAAEIQQACRAAIATFEALIAVFRRALDADAAH